MNSQTLPTKLSDDAIIEAVVELRFDLDPSHVPEIFMGRLLSVEDWKGFTPVRMPSAEIPIEIRRSDLNFTYQPFFELSRKTESEHRALRIGPQAFSIFRRSPYPGWAVFFSEIQKAIEQLVKIEPKLTVTRIGLRYVNALRSDLHGIKDISDLNLRLTVGEMPISERINLNYVKRDADKEATVRVVTADLASGNVPTNATAIIDIDVYTNSDFRETDAAAIFAWIDSAHTYEKHSFFELLTHETVQRLRSK